MLEAPVSTAAPSGLGPFSFELNSARAIEGSVTILTALPHIHRQMLLSHCLGLDDDEVVWLQHRERAGGSPKPCALTRCYNCRSKISCRRSVRSRMFEPRAHHVEAKANGLSSPCLYPGIACSRCDRLDLGGGMESHEIILNATFATSEESAAPLIRTGRNRSLTMPLR